VYDILYVILDIIRPVDIDEAELVESYIIFVVIIYEVKHKSVIIQRQLDTAILKSINKFMELNHAIKIDVKASKCHPIVFEFLLKPEMDFP